VNAEWWIGSELVVEVGREADAAVRIGGVMCDRQERQGEVMATKAQRTQAVIEAAKWLVESLEDDENHLGKTLASYIRETTCSCPCPQCPADLFMKALMDLDKALDGFPDYETYYDHSEPDASEENA
jgi:hypothetical protein